jgi:hypothetical protein
MMGKTAMCRERLVHIVKLLLVDNVPSAASSVLIVETVFYRLSMASSVTTETMRVVTFVQLPVLSNQLVLVGEDLQGEDLQVVEVVTEI